MALWLVRAGGSGEYENQFLDDDKIYLTWNELDVDLNKYLDKDELRDMLLDKYDDAKRNAVRNWRGQIFAFAHRIQKGDWVVLPSKRKSTIHIGKVKGDYKFHPKAENPFYHSREVDWFAIDIPRSNFDQDILYSFGAFMTVCQIQRNNAEDRVKKMKENDWIVRDRDIVEPIDGDTDEENATFDVERYALDQITRMILSKYKGHKLESLIESILNAKGYTTYKSPKGPDGGIDIIGAKGAMGFESPKIVVQVKSSAGQTDRPTLDQLIGAIHNYGADFGLLVSWGGFKSSVTKETAKHFFKVRLWSETEIVHEFLENYELLDDEIKASIPLKKVHALSLVDEVSG